MKRSVSSIHAGGLLAALLIGVCAAPAAFAQKTYRCGNTYQSYPCTGTDAKGVPLKTPDSGGAKAGAAAGAAAGVTAAAAADKGGKPATSSAAASNPPAPTEEEKRLAAAKAAEDTEAKKKAAVAAEKKSKCDKINNDVNYNTAQLRSGGSQTTQDRLNAERRKLNDDLRQAGC